MTAMTTVNGRALAALTVGEVADQLGVTVRTLHHCDKIGLLVPSGRTSAGYRLYAVGDITRLQHVVKLFGDSFGDGRGRYVVASARVTEVDEPHTSGMPISPTNCVGETACRCVGSQSAL